ncbi:dihydrolipoamide acetyltransferase family protein [Nocardia blacklockiae]|uniref:dihydrolipoamide acetyltransferase family protein n=1 Tax=Nocardia blacklockiae TaxID=480036 RepID=UPI001896157A|nr:dihydrolipoamide acetyltransferase family protein [Nocardia blacklockiae]MBF6175218.1 2-oxo acid dehydrogenase subunit E2 [Nocardia blacklockiae]
MPEITMPRLSDTMEDGIIASWLKQVGDPVARGEVLAEIETDKALMELEAYDDGVLEQILAEAGARVPIGEPIAIVGDGSGSGAGGTRTNAGAQGDSNGGAGGAQSATAHTGPGAQTSSPTDAGQPVPAGALEAAGNGVTVRSGSAGTQSISSTAPASPALASAAGGSRPKSSPLARKVARELGVDLATVSGTGPGGRITRQDVEVAHSTATPAITGQASENAQGTALPPGDYDEVPLTTIQRVSAARLTESKQQAPHIYLTSAIDVTELLAFRAELNGTLEAAGKGKVSVNDLLVKAVASTLRAEPAVNVSVAGDKLLRHHGIHLGVAVATPAGLLVPVIRDADRKSVSEIAAAARDLAGRARDRKLRAEEMSGGTFTISNLGMFGIEHFTAVINPPEAAILAVGAAQDELRLAGDEVVARKILRVTLSADHRAIDGAVAAQFLRHLKDLLEHPLRIVA